MLSNAEAVDLVEKCARLHIFASHHLAHLDRAEFDQQMNTENLTKSPLSLLLCLLSPMDHCYADASKRCGTCTKMRGSRASTAPGRPSSAPTTSSSTSTTPTYSGISPLLRTGGRGLECGRNVRQVLEYPNWVRESAAVRLSLRLLVALQNNNWVRFFGLVRRQADFLQVNIPPLPLLSLCS